MNNRQYPQRDSNLAINPVNKDFIANIKTHHFDVGNPRPRTLIEAKKHYLSETNLSYNNKGNAAKLRSVLDAKKKADLRANHFEIGGRTADYKQPMSKLDFRPTTAKERANARTALNVEKQADLRASHWSVGSTPNLNANLQGGRNANKS